MLQAEGDSFDNPEEIYSEWRLSSVQSASEALGTAYISMQVRTEVL